MESSERFFFPTLPGYRVPCRCIVPWVGSALGGKRNLHLFVFTLGKLRYMCCSCKAFRIPQSNDWISLKSWDQIHACTSKVSRFTQKEPQVPCGVTATTEQPRVSGLFRYHILSDWLCCCARILSYPWHKPGIWAVLQIDFRYR